MESENLFVALESPRSFRRSTGYRALLSGQEVFVKQPMTDEESQRQFANELSMLRFLVGQPHVLVPVEIQSDRIIYPFIENSLLDFVFRMDSACLISDVLRPLLSVLGHLHSKSIVHADVKLENIRITNSGALCLADFGRATSTKRHAPNRIGALSQHHPPDLTLSPGFDIYGVGVLTYQILFGLHFVRDFALRGRSFKNIPESKDVPDLLIRFIEKATAVSACERFQSAHEALDFLNGAENDRLCIIETYALETNFEIYLDCMKQTFLASRKPIRKFDQFVGDHGQAYHRRLLDWSMRPDTVLIHLKHCGRISGILEASVSKEGAAMISTLFVAASSRKQGFATQLEAYACRHFHALGYKKIHLNVSTENPEALAFYLRTGWTKELECQYPNSVRLSKLL